MSATGVAPTGCRVVVKFDVRLGEGGEHNHPVDLEGSAPQGEMEPAQIVELAFRLVEGWIERQFAETEDAVVATITVRVDDPTREQWRYSYTINSSAPAGVADILRHLSAIAETAVFTWIRAGK